MGNKVKFNLKNVHAAKLTETEKDAKLMIFSGDLPDRI